MKRQCKAKAKSTGRRCKSPPIHGAVVCRKHGGSAPQVKKKARERFNDLVDPAINILAKAMVEAEGRDDPVTTHAMAAAKDILDRAGHKPGLELNLGGSLNVQDPGREELTDADLKRLLVILRKTGKN